MGTPPRRCGQVSGRRHRGPVVVARRPPRSPHQRPWS